MRNTALLCGWLLMAAACGTDTTPNPSPEGGAGGSGGGGGSRTNGAAGNSSIAGAAAGNGEGGTGNATGTGNASGSHDGNGEGGSAASESGVSGASGADGGGGGNSPPTCDPWPTAGETVELTETLEVTGTLDGGMKRYVGAGDLGGDGQSEDLPPLMELADGAVLKNVILGNPASDGIHCTGSCTLQNVWWEDVGEDAATFKGDDADQVMLIECAGARHASDKVFQHNGPGRFVLRDVHVDDFGKLYRSCGNCSNQYARHVELTRVHATEGDALVGINANYGDTADFSEITVDPDITICTLYEANDSGDEPEEIGDGPDPDHCRYQESDITHP